MGRTTSTIAARLSLTVAEDAGTVPPATLPEDDGDYNLTYTKNGDNDCADGTTSRRRRSGYDLEKRGRLERRQRSARLIQPPDREFHGGAEIDRRWVEPTRPHLGVAHR